MPTFSYIAKDTGGNSIKAHESAPSEHELKIRLARKNLTIISISEMKKPEKIHLFGSGIKTAELVIFCKQLATMIRGGVPLLRAIDCIADEVKNPLFKSVLSEIGRHVKSGESLSSGFRKFSNLFSPLFISIVEAGEKVGSLDIMLDRLSAYLQARDRLNKKIITALTYPSFVVAFFVVAVAVMTLFLVPKFKTIYSGFGAQLPVLTRVVFSFSDTVVNNIWPVIIITSVALFFAHRYFFKSVRGIKIRDTIAIKMPVFGVVVMNAALSKFARTLATLLSQDIPVATALELVSKSSGNVVIEESIDKIKALIMDGENIPEALKKAQIFPPLMIQMTTVGVESGSLPELLDKTADFYEDRVGDFVASLTTMIEPVLIVSLGIVIGIFIIAMYMPIFSLSQTVVGARIK
ncbi:MAG: type II secretion system F family protein [Candidatus Omnitrophota bacterium]|nr:type II secretion system F family protein [Candidatus Omnitrophota bacterium]